MENKIAYCGLDCEACSARIATVNNDDSMREKVAKLWSDLNGAEIKPEMINCLGCRADGVKTVFCESMCEIRKCAIAKNASLCSACYDFSVCEKIRMITESKDSYEV